MEKHKEETHGWTNQKSRCDFAGWWDCSFFCNKLSKKEKIVPCGFNVPDFERCKSIGYIKMKRKRIDRFISQDGDFQLTLLNPPADAVARQAGPGFKAGNLGIDAFYDARRKSLEERTTEGLFLRISRRINHWQIVNGEKPSIFKKNIDEYLSRKDKDRKEIEANLLTMLRTNNNQAYLDSSEIVDKTIDRLYSRGIDKRVTFYYEYMIHNAEKRIIKTYKSL